MKLYLASFSAQEKNYGGADKQEKKYLSLGLTSRLFSNFHLNRMKENFKSFQYLGEIKKMQNQISLFLDSGAFSAWSKGIEININEYINFIKKYQKYLTVYAVLDDINSPEITWKNQKYMEDAGLNPLPVFHYGEDEKWLSECMKYDYFALGGMVPISNAKLKPWLDKIWRKLVDKDGYAKFKVHGFGLTSVELMKRYPWYSVDSTSWVMTGRFGSVMCNIGSINKVCFSDKKIQKDAYGSYFEGSIDRSHYTQMNSRDQENIKKYFADRGFTIEELATDYKKRDEANIKYFLELEEQITKNPPRFLSHEQGSLF